MPSGRSDRRFDVEWSEAVDRAEGTARDLEQDAEAVVNRHPRAARLASLVRDVRRQQSAEQVGLAASGAAFWLVISAFPTGAAVVSLFGLVVSPTQVANDLGTLARAAPTSLGSLITDQLRRVAGADRAGLSIGLLISVVGAVWSASAGVYHLDRAIRSSFGLPRQRYAEARTRALAGACTLVAALGGLALGASVVIGHAPAVVMTVAAVPCALAALTAGIATMYRLSAGSTVRVRQLLPGAVCAAAGVVVSLGAFSAYVATSTRYAAVYGAFAGLVIGMIGLYLAVYAVLLGAVLNARLRRS